MSINKVFKDVQEAINNRKTMVILYHDKERHIIPVAVGHLGSGDGAFSAFQTSPNKPSWKLFKLEDVEDHVVNDVDFDIPEDYSGPHPYLIQVTTSLGSD